MEWQRCISEIEPNDLSGKWFTSPYCQIEPAMAFQLGLPILMLREKGVIAEGVLEKGVTGLYLPEFEMSNSAQSYLTSSVWMQSLSQWEANVRKVNEKKGYSPQIY